MFKRDQVLQTKNFSPWVNTDQFIILHSTGVLWTEGNLKTLLGQTGRAVSVHFFIDREGKAYKLADPKQITWHAGESFWGNLCLMNRYSMGIEVEGVDDFTDAQFNKVIELVQYLKTTFNVPKSNILTHACITWGWCRDMRLWDGHTHSRKTDINRNFRWARGINSFMEFRDKYFS